MNVRKILCVIPSLEIGGTETQLFLLLQELKKTSHLHLEIFALKAQGPLKPQLDQLGIKIHDGAKHKFLLGKIGSLLYAFYQLWLTVRVFKPDLLHAFLPVPNFMAAAMRIFRPSLKIMTSKRALNTHQDRYPLWSWIDRVANALSHFIVVNSTAVYQDTLRRDRPNPVKVHCIHNGLDPRPFQKASLERSQYRKMFNLESHHLGIVTVGNFYFYKGHQDFLQAIATLPALIPDFSSLKVFLVGEDKGQEAMLKHQTESLNIQVTFLGPRQDIPQILSAMDIFVLPSHEEGFSNALLEAMAAKLAIIATHVGGNKEALQEGNLGLLVPPHNSALLEQALIKMIKNPILRTSLGQKAEEHVLNNFSVQAMTEKYLKLYKSF